MSELGRKLMKNQWTNFYTGYVLVKAYGKGTERLINALIRQKTHIWDIKRTGTDQLVFFIDVKEISKLRQAVRQTDCKVTFIKGRGGPFFLKKMLKNSGFIAGLFAFLLSIFILSNMIWGIEVYDAEPETEYEIRKELDKMGVRIGKIQFFLDDVEEIQRRLSERIEVLTWVGVELKGTTYHLRVVEKEQPEEIEEVSPQNLVAKKTAVITKMVIEKGQPTVSINDFVVKGQLLVSGVIGKDDYKQLVPATGMIYGETWYKAVVEVPLTTHFSVLNGDEYSKHYVGFGGVRIPVWGFKEPEYKAFEIDSTEKPLHFFQWTLPISYQVSTKRSKEEIVRKYSKDEAIQAAKKMAKGNVEKQISDEAEIIGEKVLHETIENGKVKLSIHYQVIENIAMGQSIIQGD
jgi:similar to stage IV sporulation protein